MKLRQMRGKWYARIRIWDGIKVKEYSLSLNTTDKADAYTRLEDVKLLADEIYSGNIEPFQFKALFKWNNASGTSTLVKRTIQDVICDYLEYRRGVVRKSTADRDRVSLKQLTDFLGLDKPIEEISYRDIEGSNGFIKHLQNNGYKDAGIGITLRHVKTFFSFLLRDKLITEPIKFKMVDAGKQLPRYFNEKEIKAIHKMKDLDDFWKDCFYFYEMTGVRPKEPLLGDIMGDWLIIDPKYTKGKNVRQIPLNDRLKAILIEMHRFRDSYEYKPAERAYERIAKTLMRSVRKLGFTGKRLSLKSFRHTYAVRRITTTGNIYQVMREMGHTQVTTTQLYLEFPEQRRLDDFPSLRKYIEKDMVVNGSDFSRMGTPNRAYANPPIRGSS